MKQFLVLITLIPIFKVRVNLIEEPDVCSAASKRGLFRQEVKVRPQSTRSVPFIIIPMKEGEFRVEVKAAVKDSSLNDGIVKVLRVVVRQTRTLFRTVNKAIILFGGLKNSC